MKKGLLIFLITIILVFGVKPFLHWQNTSVKLTKYTVTHSNIPPSFDGYRILVVADIQGFDMSQAQKILEKQQADVLVIVGDLVDEGVAGSEENIDRFLDHFSGKLPIYAVSGNHDHWTGRFPQLMEKWEQNWDITFLENKQTLLERDGETIGLYGIADPNVWDWDSAVEVVTQAQNELSVPENQFSMLLFHRANMLDLFRDQPFDLVLSGHMHGGQIRLPFVGGLKSPHGDWFPSYSGGEYRENGRIFLVSKGLGNAVQVPRILNRPEILLITLERAK